jgi:hypothetical protein
LTAVRLQGSSPRRPCYEPHGNDQRLASGVRRGANVTSVLASVEGTV